jgi:outer membrane protein assembly factor BamB
MMSDIASAVVSCRFLSFAILCFGIDFMHASVTRFHGRLRPPSPFICTLIIVLFYGTVVSQAADWPWFLGTQHTGISSEADLVLDWSKKKPPVLWKQEVGTGYSAPSLLGDQLVVHHRRKRDEVVSCRSVASGEEIWQYAYPSDFSDPYGYNNGPRCSPILANGHCITLGAEGILTCLNMENGELIWQNDLQKQFEVPDGFFGVGSSPILDGDQLIVLVGGQPNSGVVAFNRNDGSILWEAGGKLTWDGVVDANTKKPYEWTGSEMVVSYSSPIIATIHEQRHLLCLMRQGLVSLDPETGTENFHYWFRARVNDSVNAARPVVVDDQILLSAAYRVGSALLKVNADGNSYTEVWRDKRNLLAHWSTPIHLDGFVYGFSGRHENEGEFRCIRLSDGKVMWATPGFEGNLQDFARDRETKQIVNKKTGKVVPFPYFGRGSLIQVGDRFVVLGERGTLAVVDINPKQFHERGRFSMPEIHYPAWAAPVISNGKLYLRSEDWLVCLDLKTDWLPAAPSSSPQE